MVAMVSWESWASRSSSSRIWRTIRPYVAETALRRQAAVSRPTAVRSAGTGFDAKQSRAALSCAAPGLLFAANAAPGTNPTPCSSATRQEVGGPGAVGELDPAEHPARRRGARHGVGEGLADGARERGGPFPQRAAQPVEVRVEPRPVGEQLGRDGLRERGAAEVRALLEPLDGGEQRRGPGQPADAQGGREHLRGAAQSHHAVAERGHGHRRRAVEREEPVRVVLDHEEAVAVGQRGERGPAPVARVAPRGLWKLLTVCTSFGRRPAASRAARVSTSMPSASTGTGCSAAPAAWNTCSAPT